MGGLVTKTDEPQVMGGVVTKTDEPQKAADDLLSLYEGQATRNTLDLVYDVAFRITDFVNREVEQDTKLGRSMADAITDVVEVGGSFNVGTSKFEWDFRADELQSAVPVYSFPFLPETDYYVDVHTHPVFMSRNYHDALSKNAEYKVKPWGHEYHGLPSGGDAMAILQTTRKKGRIVSCILSLYGVCVFTISQESLNYVTNSKDENDVLFIEYVNEYSRNVLNELRMPDLSRPFNFKRTYQRGYQSVPIGIDIAQVAYSPNAMRRLLSRLADREKVEKKRTSAEMRSLMRMLRRRRTA